MRRYQGLITSPTFSGEYISRYMKVENICRAPRSEHLPNRIEHYGKKNNVGLHMGCGQGWITSPTFSGEYIFRNIRVDKICRAPRGNYLPLSIDEKNCRAPVEL